MPIVGQSKYAGGNSAYAGILGSAGLDALLKDLTLDIQNLIETSTPALKEFGTGELNWDGRRAVIPLHSGVSGSFAAVPEGGRLPEPGKSKHISCEVDVKYIYAQMALTGPAIAATKGNKGSLKRAINVEVDDLVAGFRFNMQRMLWGDGTGLLAKATGAGLTVTQQNVTDAFTNTSYLLEEMKVVWGTKAQLANTGGGNVPAGYGYISGITSDGVFVLTLQGGIDPVQDDYVCMGSYNSASGEHSVSYGNEFMGFKGIASETSVLQGVNPGDAGKGRWKAKLLQANGGGGNVTLTQEHLIRACLLYKKFNKDSLPDMIWGEDSMMLEVFKTLYPDQRFQPLELKAGVRTLSFTFGDKVIPFYWDSMCFRNSLLLLERKAFKYSWQQKPDWMTQFTAGKILTQTAGYDQGIGVYGGYGQFFTQNRRKCLWLSELNATIDF